MLWEDRCSRIVFSNPAAYAKGNQGPEKVNDLSKSQSKFVAEPKLALKSFLPSLSGSVLILVHDAMLVHSGPQCHLIEKV